MKSSPNYAANVTLGASFGRYTNTNLLKPVKEELAFGLSLTISLIQAAGK